jgi:hypothetical protein
MTVKELIERLECFDSNMEVKFSYNYGDYWKTDVADEISDIEEAQVTYSSYHRTDKIVDRDDEEQDDELEYLDKIKTVVILK